MPEYLSHCCLPAPLNQSGWTSLINKVFWRTEVVFALSSVNSWDHVWKSEEVSKTTQTTPTSIPQPKSLRSHFFPFMIFGLNSNGTSWSCLLAFMHFCCHVIGWLDICINELVHVEFYPIKWSLSVLYLHTDTPWGIYLSALTAAYLGKHCALLRNAWC